MEYKDLQKHEIEFCEFRPIGICQSGCSLVILQQELKPHNCIASLRNLVATQEVQMNILESDLNKMAAREKAREKSHMIQVNNLHNKILVQANKFQQKIGYYQKVIEELLVKIKADVKEKVSWANSFILSFFRSFFFIIVVVIIIIVVIIIAIIIVIIIILYGINYCW